MASKRWGWGLERRDSFPDSHIEGFNENITYLDASIAPPLRFTLIQAYSKVSRIQHFLKSIVFLTFLLCTTEEIRLKEVVAFNINCLFPEVASNSFELHNLLPATRSHRQLFSIFMTILNDGGHYFRLNADLLFYLYTNLLYEQRYIFISIFERNAGHGIVYDGWLAIFEKVKL